MEHRRRRFQRLNGKHFVFGNGANSGSAEQPARASGKRPVILKFIYEFVYDFSCRFALLFVFLFVKIKNLFLMNKIIGDK